jgi:hypothetical protein
MLMVSGNEVVDNCEIFPILVKARQVSFGGEYWFHLGGGL